MHADLVGVVGFALAEGTITWKVASGFRTHVIDDEHPLERPIANELVQRAIAANATMVLEAIGVPDELPVSDFPVHAAEGIW